MQGMHGEEPNVDLNVFCGDAEELEEYLFDISLEDDLSGYSVWGHF